MRRDNGCLNRGYLGHILLPLENGVDWLHTRADHSRIEFLLPFLAGTCSSPKYLGFDAAGDVSAWQTNDGQPKQGALPSNVRRFTSEPLTCGSRKHRKRTNISVVGMHTYPRAFSLVEEKLLFAEMPLKTDKEAAST